jgi:16S rRNA (cytidine1402-2'-O)-methyltransferase
MEMSTARLHIVATPIGNMEDITLRAIRVLSEVDVVAAEDTRHTRSLLSHHGIATPLFALHEHNEEKAAPMLIRRIVDGESVALVSDAGTPLLSDPGYRLVRLAASQSIPVVAVPGPSAVTAALSISGLATDRFAFEGFLPQKRAARIGRLEQLRSERRSLVLFESSHRIEASLGDLAEVFGSDRQAAVCREMTKQFETVLRGSLREIHETVRADADQRRGEFVIVIEGAQSDSAEELENAVQLARQLQPHLTASQSARVAAKIHGVSRRELYARLDGETGSGRY